MFFRVALICIVEVVALLGRTAGATKHPQLTRINIYTKEGPKSCKVYTKWQVSFRIGECKAIEGAYGSKDKAWAAWKSVFDDFHTYYYKPTKLSCFNDTEGEYDASETQPTLLQYYDNECTEPTGLNFSEPADVCRLSLKGSDNKTKFERLRMDCGGASTKAPASVPWLALVLWGVACAVFQ